MWVVLKVVSVKSSRRRDSLVVVKDAKIPGQKRKTSEREDRLVVRKSKSNRYKTAPQIKAEMLIEHGVIVSVSTTQRKLREAGLQVCKPRK